MWKGHWKGYGWVNQARESRISSAASTNILAPFPCAILQLGSTQICTSKIAVAGLSRPSMLWKLLSG